MSRMRSINIHRIALKFRELFCKVSEKNCISKSTPIYRAKRERVFLSVALQRTCLVGTPSLSYQWCYGLNYNLFRVHLVVFYNNACSSLLLSYI